MFGSERESQSGGPDRQMKVFEEPVAVSTKTDKRTAAAGLTLPPIRVSLS